MTRRFTLFCSIFAAASLSSAKADNYKIDPAHSNVLFKVGHFGVGNVYGRFDTFSGNFVFDQKDPTKDSVSFEISTDSVDSNFPDRDKHLKSPDFLNSKQFPTATFKSTSFKKVDEKNYEVAGNFTLHGITKPVTVSVQVIGSGPGPKGEPRLGTESTVTLKRSDFDVKTFLPAVTDDVQLTIAIEGVKQ
ncbi:MAG TPA: YceI family protein [Chthoniobacterales bacterium]|nr:YceI family protein [Chthoniobacterales bacterium]